MMAAGLELCADPEPRARVHSLARRLRDALAAGGLDCSGSSGPIVPVLVGGNEDALEAADRLQQAGLDVRAVRPPTVAPGSSRLRISVHANHSEGDIDRLASALLELLAWKETI